MEAGPRLLLADTQAIPRRMGRLTEYVRPKISILFTQIQFTRENLRSKFSVLGRITVQMTGSYDENRNLQ